MYLVFDRAGNEREFPKINIYNLSTGIREKNLFSSLKLN